MSFQEWLLSFFGAQVPLAQHVKYSYQQAYEAGHEQGYEDGYREAQVQLESKEQE